MNPYLEWAYFQAQAMPFFDFRYLIAHADEWHISEERLEALKIVEKEILESRKSKKKP